jgi:nickel-dependent lactate racemase
VTIVGRGTTDGVLSPETVSDIVQRGLDALPLDGRRVLAIVPDGTRTMPMPFMFDALEQSIGRRVARLDYLIALGTHSPMSDADLTRRFGRPVAGGRTGERQIVNHRWDDPSTFVDLGTIPASTIAEVTGGLLNEAVPVALNRLVVEYDHILISGPVFPHEVVGFSGGTKYLFPGIAAPEIIHFTHWLGALLTSFSVIGTIDTPVRRVIDLAASLLPTPVSLLALVVAGDGIAGMYVGDTEAAWREAARLSASRHIEWVDRPFDRVLSIMPPMYDDLWTAAKGMYKTEPVVADGGEVVIYAPHVDEVSRVHGRILDEIGYHCRDYFVAQWERFRRYPGGILAHSTHLKGLGTFDADRHREDPRIQVTLATGIPRDRCRRVNLGYMDHTAIDPVEWTERSDAGTLVVPHAGERLFRLREKAPSDAQRPA